MRQVQQTRHISCSRSSSRSCQPFIFRLVQSKRDQGEKEENIKEEGGSSDGRGCQQGGVRGESGHGEVGRDQVGRDQDDVIDKAPAEKKGTMIAQFSALAILLFFSLSHLVFLGEKRDQGKGEEEGRGGRGRDGGSSCRRQPETRRLRKRYVDHAVFCACSPATLLPFAFSAGKEEEQEGRGGGEKEEEEEEEEVVTVVAAALDKGVQGK